MQIHLPEDLIPLLKERAVANLRSVSKEAEAWLRGFVAEGRAKGIAGKKMTAGEFDRIARAHGGRRVRAGDVPAGPKTGH